uniref:Uncharacterized protein n=1 Tax=viral metagenome TaxID=1070528 RepID=A0A6C0C0B4_9ZZZZ
MQSVSPETQLRMRFTVMKLNGYETHREDDANLVLHTFSSVDFTFAKLDANGLS